MPGIREMEAAVVMSGSGVPKMDRKLPMDICDIAPTIATILGIPVPKDAEGGVLHEFLGK